MDLSSSTLTALIPFALGGVFQVLKVYLEGHKDFKNRERKILTDSTERIAESLVRLLREALRTENFDNMPRGDGLLTQDLYGDVASMIDKHSKRTFHILCRQRIYNSCYGVLFYGMLIGIVGFLISLTFSRSEHIVFWVCIGTACLQALAAVILRCLTQRSEHDEEIL